MRRLIAIAGLAACRLGFDDLPVESTCDPIVDVVAISSGRDFSCALLAGGDVRCWGAGDSGQLGDGARATRLEPVAPTGLGSATMISAGVQHACAVVEGALWCWGRNDTSQLGLGDRISRDVPARVGMLPDDVVGVSAGGAHTCAWTATGALYCWGQGNGVTGSSMTPARVMGIPAIAKAATSSVDLVFSTNHGCAIGVDGSAWCWGANDDGQLGAGDAMLTTSVIPVRVATPLLFVDIVAGRGHACGRTGDGVVACWGRGANGEIGDGAVENRFAPVEVSLPPSVEIAANDETTCARDGDGIVRCWGDNDLDQLAREGRDGLVPEQIDLPRTRAISVGDSHSCAILETGVVSCWGSDRAGQRSGVLDLRARMVGVDAVSIAAGGDTTCAIGSDRRLRCWGGNTFGQLGDGTRTSRAIPVDVGLADVTHVSVGEGHTCALADSRVACWGDNERDQVILDGEADYLVPQIISGVDIMPTMVAAGAEHTCALGVSGVPWCWGNTLEGRLGRGVPSSDASAPISSLFANAVTITTGRAHTCIITSSNQAWCSGRDNEGQIGRADNTGDVYQPLEVTAAPSAVQISAGRGHTCAISSTGGAWCWGDNAARQLGDGGDLRADEPVALSLTGLVEIAAGVTHTCARDAANTVWCWGANTSGQLGDGTLATRGLPVIATELAGAVELVVGASHTCVRMADGSVRCVGAVQRGQTGSGSALGSGPIPARLTCP